MHLARKKQGDSAVAGGMVAVMLSLAVIFTAIFIYASWQEQFLHTYEVDLVLHKYLARLESADYSSQKEIDMIFGELGEELEKMGVTETCFEGSTTTPVEPGSRITLRARGTMTLSVVEMPEDVGMAGAAMTERNVEFDITKSGTAMY